MVGGGDRGGEGGEVSVWVWWARLIDHLGLDGGEVVEVSGLGCSKAWVVMVLVVRKGTV